LANWYFLVTHQHLGPFCHLKIAAHETSAIALPGDLEVPLMNDVSCLFGDNGRMDQWIREFRNGIGLEG
jgi:hypothetical protein